MFTRILLTLLSFATWGVAQAFLRSTTTVVSAATAGRQFDNSDAAGVTAQVTLSALSHLQLSGLLLLLVLVAIWQAPVRRWVAALIEEMHGPMVPVIIAGLLGLAGSVTPAQAFYATTDVTEVVYILPNWSAFFVPDTGANKDSQAGFGSIDYLNANKIASKRFIIPHAKLSGTGGTSMLSGPDYYVPTGRLIIVDRTPYFREWVDESDRGTSARKEGFHFESKDSVDIGTGVTISAYVTETNSATFLYWFGTQTVGGDTSRPEVQFSSVLHATSLATVMDGVVRAKVQESLANEFSKRNFDQAIAEKGQIIKAVADAVKGEFAQKGITIDFLGYSGPLDFSPAIQAAIDQTIVASRLKSAAETLTGVMPVLQQRTYLDAVTTLSQRWDGKMPSLPSVLVLPKDIAEIFTSLPHGGPAASQTSP